MFSKRTEESAFEVLEGRKKGIRSYLPFLGPAFVASVAYIDPGNFATNIQSGAQYGYLLVWVVILANIMGMLVQILSAKVGIATGKNLAELCRDRFPKPVVYFLWILAEIVAMATDVAEIVGAALGFHLLFGIPLFGAGIITAIFNFLLLALEKKGFRPLEVIITSFVVVIVLAFAIQVFFVHPDLKGIAEGLVPRFSDRSSILLATAILGATIMPHVIYLHSALTQRRVKPKKEEHLKKLYHFQLADVYIAMTIAGLINVCMLIIAAAVFHSRGLFSIIDIEPAFKALGEIVGKFSDELFGIALLVSGLSSSIVGTMAGQIVMQGFVHFRMSIFLRRAITIIPSLIILTGILNPTSAMIFSQVILSFGIPFALIPLIMFTRNRVMMRDLTNHPLTTLAAYLVTFFVIGLNVYLIIRTFYS